MAIHIHVGNPFEWSDSDFLGAARVNAGDYQSANRIHLYEVDRPRQASSGPRVESPHGDVGGCSCAPIHPLFSNAQRSGILLGGLLLNALLGWWWADPVAALIMVPIIVKEGIEALRGETCCDEGACH